MRILSRLCLWCNVCCSLLSAAIGPLSAQTFKNPPLIPTSTDPLSITSIDINHDGKLDLIYVDGFRYGNDAVHILLGNGNGTFPHGQDMNLPANICCAVTVA